MSRRLKVAAALTATVVLVAGGAWWLTRSDAPARVSLEAAVASVTTTSTTEPASSTTTVAAAADASEASDTSATDVTTTTTPAAVATPTTSTGAPSSLAGTWSVDTTTGAFDYESATGSFAGFRIAEELAGIGATEAVGRTGDVTGTITVAGTKLTAARFTVDLTTITTNNSMRDDKVQSALETSRFPTATFVLTQAVELGTVSAGKRIDVVAAGNLTIHGVTRRVSIPLQAQLVDDTAVVVGSLDLTFADHGVAVPASRIVVSVEDHGTLAVQLLLVR
jgi:polyisoprenoid-binding protein YceI